MPTIAPISRARPADDVLVQVAAREHQRRGTSGPCFSSSVNHTLPVASNDSTVSSYCSSGASTNCSCEQMMPLSNDAPVTIFVGRFLDVHVAVDDHRHVAGADAERRLARRVGRLHHRAAAGGDDDVDDLHQLLRRLDRAVLDRLDQVVGPAVRLHDLHELAASGARCTSRPSDAARRSRRCRS